jgi:glyoxylase-like metal-dependent hydrolase (beta-lactamase superfamily II)
MSNLTWDVFVAPPIPTVTDDPPPGEAQRVWSPISATLISGQRDAVLVDPALTMEQGRAVADWVASSGKNLTTIYATHGHGDHWFGATEVLDRFPDAQFVAAPIVVEHMTEQGSRATIADFWDPRFPGQITRDPVMAEPLVGDTFELEGHEMVAVPLGHTDTDDSTCLHVPDIGLVVAGDSAYNDVHLYLAESSPEGRDAWVAGLDAIESLSPQTVIAGHKRATRADSPAIIEETREYIRDFDRISDDTNTAQELYEAMLALYPARVNPGALWISARALKP